MILNPITTSSVESRTGSGNSKPQRFTPIDPLRVLRVHARLLSITAFVSLILGVALWYMLRLVAPQYTSNAQLTITGGISDPYQLVQQSNDWGRKELGLIDTLIRNQIVRIESDEVIKSALLRDDVRSTEWFKPFADNVLKARDSLQDNLSADRIKGTTLINVSFTAGNPNDPPRVLDAVIGVYLERLASESLGETESVRQTIRRERDRAEEDQKQVEEQLKQFKVQNDLSALESRTHEATIAYQMLSEQKVKLEVSLQQAREAYPALQEAYRTGTNNYSSQSLAEAEADPAVAVRNERLRSLREQRQVYLERFGDTHRIVKEIDLQIEAAEQEKKRQMDQVLRQRQALRLEEVQNVISSLEAQLQGIQPRIEENRAHIRDLGQKIEEYRRIEARAVEYAQRRAKAEQLLNSMRIQSDRPDSTQVRRVFSATEAEMSFPQAAVMIPGMVVFFTGLMTGFVFLKESLDQRIKSPADVALLPECTLLGVVPDAAEDPSGSKHFASMVRVKPTGLVAESFRQIRSALLAVMEPRGYKTLMIVGAQPGCGASSVVQNLAASLSYQGKKVLVMDLNFRRPSQHELFGVSPEPGLNDVLGEAMGFDEAVVQTEMPGVDFLPVGHHADAVSEVIDSPVFSRLLLKLRDRYDVVLIDVPPALVTSDSALIAKHVDAIAVVIRAIEDRRGMIGRMLRQLGSHRAHLLGVILNGVRSSAGGYFRKNYEQFYRYHHRAALPAPSTEAIEKGLVEAAAEEESPR